MLPYNGNENMGQNRKERRFLGYMVVIALPLVFSGCDKDQEQNQSATPKKPEKKEQKIKDVDPTNSLVAEEGKKSAAMSSSSFSEDLLKPDLGGFYSTAKAPDISKHLDLKLRAVGKENPQRLTIGTGGYLVCRIDCGLKKRTVVPFYTLHPVPKMLASKSLQEAALPMLQWKKDGKIIRQERVAMPMYWVLEPGYNRLIIPIRPLSSGSFELVLTIDNSTLKKRGDMTTGSPRRKAFTKHFMPTIRLTARLELKVLENDK